MAGLIPPRILVMEPPRHGKSEMVSKWLPAWFLGTWPDKRVALAAYEDDFAATWGRRVREILEQYGQSVFGVTTRDDSRARNRWDLRQTWSPEDPELADWWTSAEGGMFTTGIGGALTGKGADLLIVDDPVKNQQEADSPTVRDRTWDWWTSTAYTRMEPGAIAIVMQTRWHEDDLAGKLLKQAKDGGEEWHVVRLPAVAETDDPLGREPGEALWPDRYPPKELTRIRKAVGSRVWTALYQQSPAPDEGGLIHGDWFGGYARRPSRFSRVVQSWDMAFKDTKGSDYVVGQVWGEKGADRYLLAQVRGKLNFPATKKAVRSLNRWVVAHGYQPGLILIEDKANGPAVISEMRSEISGLVAVNPEGGKVARVNAVSPQIESGNVLLPEGTIPAPVGFDPTPVDEFLTECKQFPNGANDDQVDAMSQALNRMRHGTASIPADATPAEAGQDLLREEM